MKFLRKAMFNPAASLIVMAACIGVAVYHRDVAVTALAIAAVMCFFVTAESWPKE